MIQQICFCTLAVGRRYRAHARLLAADIQKYAPDIPFVVLTDRPTEFESFSNVLAYKHHLHSVEGYHDKRLVIEAAIAHFETCLFLDSDVRILGPISIDIDFPPGLTGRFGCSILKHNKHNKVRPALPFIENAAKILHLDLDKVIWLHEFMFAVRRQKGLEKKFLHYWKVLEYYFQMNGIYSGEGDVMGLSAAAAGFNVGFNRIDCFPFFKDNIEKEQIKVGKSTLEDKIAYFKAHQAIEYPQRGLTRKAIEKIHSKMSFHYRLEKLKMDATKDLDFQTFIAKGRREFTL